MDNDKIAKLLQGITGPKRMSATDPFDADLRLPSIFELPKRTEVKRFTVKPEWKSYFDKLKAQEERVAKEIRRLNSLHKYVWGMVETETGETDNMTWDETTNEIIVWKN